MYYCGNNSIAQADTKYKKWRYYLLLVFFYTYPLYPLPSRTDLQPYKDIYGWEGEFKGEGASPPLEYSPPLEQPDGSIKSINGSRGGHRG
jgi:hypothetical protein